jgi:signal transduction histidine kinase
MWAYLENELLDCPDRSPGEDRQTLQTIRHETLKLQLLVEDLFTLSQLDERRLSLDCAPVDISPVIERVITSLKKVAWDNKRIELCAQLPPAMPPAWADERRLEQVLSNLAQNAIRYTPPGGIILLQGEPVGEALQISVTDSGEGISPADLPHIWNRFYRGVSESGPGRTGIGLSLVKELVEAMGGIVGVDNRPGEGSRFWLQLKKAPVSPA